MATDPADRLTVLRYDVFTDRPYAGNPLAVAVDPPVLTTGTGGPGVVRVATPSTTWTGTGPTPWCSTTRPSRSAPASSSASAAP